MAAVYEKMAEAMKAKRAELINQPLANIWDDLAKAAIEAIGLSEYEAQVLCDSGYVLCDGYCHEHCGLSNE